MENIETKGGQEARFYGHTCPRCFQWVSNTMVHACAGWNTGMDRHWDNQSGMYADSNTGRIAEALERIAEVLEGLRRVSESQELSLGADLDVIQCDCGNQFFIKA